MSYDHDAYIVFTKDDASSDWASQFQTHLSFVVQRLSKRSVAVASSLESKKPLDKITEIEKLLDKSALIILQTPNPIFFADTKAITTSKKIQENKDRIFQFITSGTEEESFILNNKGTFSFTFHDTDSNTLSLLTPQNPKMEAQYWQRTTDLAYALSDSLKAFAQKEVKKATGKPSIYLAETTIDQNHNRDIIKWELNQYGYSVLPDKPLSKDSASAKKEIKEYLGKCILSIHILGDQYGDIISGSELSMNELQNKVAIEYIKESSDKTQLPRLIWIPPGLQPKDVNQTKFVENLQHIQEELIGGEIIQTPLEVLKSIIKSKISETVEFSSAKKDTSTKSVYLIHEGTSNENLNSILDVLKKKKLSVVTSDDITKQKNMVSAHRKTLASADALLIYYNTTNPFWINSKLRDSIKAPGYGRSKPFDVKAIFLGENGTMVQSPFTKDILVMNQEKTFKESILEPFMKQILQ